LQIKALKDFGPSLEFMNSHSVEDPECKIAGYGLQPDIMVYNLGSVTKDNPTQFWNMEMHIEVKLESRFDGFQDPPPPKDSSSPQDRSHCVFERKSDDSIATRGQIIAYALAQLGTQFRTFAFSVLVCGSFARLLRWDRAGAVVSSAFNYTQNPEYLADFFWRYNSFGSDKRGYDMTVSYPTHEESHIAANCLSYFASSPSVNLASPISSPLVKFKVSMEGKPDAFYVGGRPVFQARSLSGRATRCFIVYDLVKARVVYLKDTWRVDAPGVQREADIYQILHEHNTPHIAPLERAGDVSNNSTVTQDMREKVWACKTFQTSSALPNCSGSRRTRLDIF
jgi:Fungal protein kinase